MIGYKYTDGDGKPLLECPGCGSDLDKRGAITLVLSIAGQTVEVPSELTSGGVLVDTNDNAVGKGFHSSTVCNGCTEPLIDYDDVVIEEQIEIPDTSQPMTEAEYVKHGGNKCPFCRGGSVEFGDFSLDGATGKTDDKCNSCRKTWTSFYSLTGYQPGKSR